MQIQTASGKFIGKGARRPSLVLAALLTLVTACTGSPNDEASGQEIYLQLCVNCHAEDLTGGIGPALGPGSNAAGQPDEFLEVTITRGRGAMPSFSTSLDTGQLDRLIGYLREEQGR